MNSSDILMIWKASMLDGNKETQILQETTEAGMTEIQYYQSC